MFPPRYGHREFCCTAKMWDRRPRLSVTAEAGCATYPPEEKKRPSRRCEGVDRSKVASLFRLLRFARNDSSVGPIHECPTFSRGCTECGAEGWKGDKPSAIRTGQLRPLPILHLPPIKQVVFLRPYSLEGMGRLILGGASCLDAFSAYPFRP